MQQFATVFNLYSVGKMQSQDIYCEKLITLLLFFVKYTYSEIDACKSCGMVQNDLFGTFHG